MKIKSSVNCFTEHPVINQSFQKYKVYQYSKISSKATVRNTLRWSNNYPNASWNNYHHKWRVMSRQSWERSVSEWFSKLALNKTAANPEADIVTRPKPYILICTLCWTIRIYSYIFWYILIFAKSKNFIPLPFHKNKKWTLRIITFCAFFPKLNSEQI
jgi:hypothetical protein